MGTVGLVLRFKGGEYSWCKDSRVVCMIGVRIPGWWVQLVLEHKGGGYGCKSLTADGDAMVRNEDNNRC